MYTYDGSEVYNIHECKSDMWQHIFVVVCLVVRVFNFLCALESLKLKFPTPIRGVQHLRIWINPWGGIQFKGIRVFRN